MGTGFTDQQSCFANNAKFISSFKSNNNKTNYNKTQKEHLSGSKLFDEYINEKIKALNKKGKDTKNEEYDNNKDISANLLAFVMDNKAIDREQIKDKRYIATTLM